MKKNILIASLLVLFSFGAMAQKDNAVSIGVKGGINMPRMHYVNNKYLSSLPQAWKITPTGGVFVDVPIGDVLVIAPEFDYVQRGTDITYEHISGMQVHYAMSITFVDFRIPFEFRIPIKPYLQPFIQLGAEGGYRLGGHIHIDRSDPAPIDATIDVGDANYPLIHAGAFGGLGLRSLVTIGNFDMLFKLTASYHHGFLNSYTKSEIDETVPAVNVNAYNITGSRFAEGIEVCVSIGIPLRAREDDACRTFSRDRVRRRSVGRGLFGY